MNLLETLNNKKILIWGYGLEGKSTHKFIKENSPSTQVEIFEGKYEEINTESYDLIFKSPGIPMPIDNEKITSQAEVFIKDYKDKIIGITGTKGKSTTSTMLYETLKQVSTKKILLLGNIGIPFLDAYNEIDDNTIVVCELSCHQLLKQTSSPHIAIFLNLFEDHLDVYKTRENYFLAKLNITNYQTNNDYLLVSKDTPSIDTLAKVIEINKDKKFNLTLKGEHNQLNANFVYYIIKNILNIDNEEQIIKSIEEFNGLKHRLELVKTLNEVNYYDDSISTIPEATIQAANSIENTKTILIGGMDRNINYDILIDFIQKKQNITFICMYESGKRIYNSLTNKENVIYIETLKEAVAKAKEITPKNSACILSPAAASYGYFKNFEERGDSFKKYLED